MRGGAGTGEDGMSDFREETLSLLQERLVQFSGARLKIGVVGTVVQLNFTSCTTGHK